MCVLACGWVGSHARPPTHARTSPPPPPAPPQLLDLNTSLAVWASVYYSAHISLVLLELVGAVMPPRRPRRTVKPEGSAAGGADGVGEGGAALANGAAAAGAVAAALKAE